MRGVIFIILAVHLMQAVAETPAPRKPRPGVSDPNLRIPIERLVPEAVYPVPGHPDWLVIDEHTWVSSAPSNVVAQLDPKSSRVLSLVTVGKNPNSGIAVGFGSVWVPLCGDNVLARLDIKTAEITARIPMTFADEEGGIAVGAGSVWVLTDLKSTLARIDPTNNTVVAEIRVASGSSAVAFGENSVFVTSTKENLLLRVDPKSNLVTDRIKVGPSPRFLAIGEGSAWTLNQGDGSVTRVDPKSSKVVATIEVGVPGGGGEISVGEGSVWVTSFEFPITRIDPRRNQVVQQFYGPGGDAIRVGQGWVWLSNLREGNVWRIDPRRIEATRLP